MADDLAIKVQNVSKTFKLPHEKQNSIKGLFVNIFRPKRTYEQQQVLKNISFEVKKGEFFGIVGRNGSGKSTLMKLVAGIYTPDQGAVQVNGKLVPFIELGVGFNPNLTGRENVYLNGALLGFSRREMQAMYDEIVEFAELEKFMDQKLKNYSSGMQVRLAFSIAIRAKGDILLLDEVLAVGDEDFQRKCYDYFKTLKKNQKTVVFISHDMGAVRSFCNRAILIEDGKLTLEGTANEIADEYSDMFLRAAGDTKTEGNGKRFGNGDARIINVSAKVDVDNIIIKSKAIPNKDIEELEYGLQIFGQDGREITGMNNRTLKLPDVKNVHAGQTVSFEWKIQNIFNDDKFYASLSLADGRQLLDRYDEAVAFRVKRPQRSTTTVLPPVTVNFKVTNK